MRERILLGFSGGIDSVTAVGLLRDMGYDVVALTLDMVGDDTLCRKASSVAKQLDIEHHILDVGDAFSKNIVDYFIDSYLRGHTPAPCTICNPLVKWHYLSAFADELGIKQIATGHYFNIEKCGDKSYVARAADTAKDQSYYLWGLDQATLSRIVTPMGNIIKEQIKRSFADKRESMGVCFLQGRLYRDFITLHHPEAMCRGDVVDLSGSVVGSHDGIAFYTIGQKRGFECTLPGAVVTDIDSSTNRLIVGSNNDLYKHTIEISQCNIVDEDELLTATDISVIVRGLGRNPSGYIRSVEVIPSGYRLVLDSPAWALALGQPVVLYRGNRVLGGGFICGRY